MLKPTVRTPVRSTCSLQKLTDEAVAAEFTPRIGKVATRGLVLNGYTRYEQLTRVGKLELLAIHGVGRKAIEILDDELAARGLAFAEGG